ncbi:phosphopantothenate synthase, partial [Burkholderia multivorans]
KMKKPADRKMPPLEFVENPDILASVAALPDPPFCVGFAAERQRAEIADQQRHVLALALFVAVHVEVAAFGREADA